MMLSDGSWSLGIATTDDSWFIVVNVGWQGDETWLIGKRDEAWFTVVNDSELMVDEG